MGRSGADLGRRKDGASPITTKVPADGFDDLWTKRSGTHRVQRVRRSGQVGPSGCGSPLMTATAAATSARGAWRYRPVTVGAAWPAKAWATGVAADATDGGESGSPVT